MRLMLVNMSTNKQLICQSSIASYIDPHLIYMSTNSINHYMTDAYALSIYDSYSQGYKLIFSKHHLMTSLNHTMAAIKKFSWLE